MTLRLKPNIRRDICTAAGITDTVLRKIENKRIGRWTVEKGRMKFVYVLSLPVIGEVTFRECDYFEDAYEASKWNRYPDATPPPLRMMRVEGFTKVNGKKTAVRTCAKWRGGQWLFSGDWQPNSEITVTRFRPWSA